MADIFLVADARLSAQAEIAQSARGAVVQIHRGSEAAKDILNTALRAWRFARAVETVLGLSSRAAIVRKALFNEMRGPALPRERRSTRKDGSRGGAPLIAHRSNGPNAKWE
jgi:hypothetical protein